MRIYNPQESGIVLKPEENNVFCAYVTDSGTDMRRCDPPGKSDRCTPGCSGKGVNAGGPEWCVPFEPFGSYCSWAPQHLNWVMEISMPTHTGPHGAGYQNGGGHYNELVIDAFHFQDHLPWSIEAFWYDPLSSKDGGASQRVQHAAFLAEFEVTALAVPLLKLEYSSDRQRMFSPA